MPPSLRCYCLLVMCLVGWPREPCAVRWVQSTARMAPLGTVGDQPQLSRQSAEVTPTPAAYRCRGAAQPFTSGCTPGHSGSSSLALPGLPHTQPYAAAASGRPTPRGGWPLLSFRGISPRLGGTSGIHRKDLQLTELVCAPVASSGTRMVAPQLGTYVGPRVPVQ